LTPYPNPSRHPCQPAPPTRTLTHATTPFFASVVALPMRSRPGAALGREKDASVVCFRARALSRLRALAGVASPPHRFVRRRRRISAGRATLDRFVASPAALRCRTRANSCPGTLDWVSPARAPPSAAVHRRRPSPPPLARTRAISVVRSGSAASDQTTIRSRSNGSDQSSPGQYRSNRHALSFLQKPP
jgi:hypothetical protein